MSDPISVEYNGWQYYSSEGNVDLSGVKIIPKEKIEEPKSLFKYCSLSENGIDALKNQYLYASCPLDLNDPFDSMNLLVDYSNVDFNQLYFFYRDKGYSLEYVKCNMDKFLNKFKLEFPMYMFTGMGVISLSSVGNNPLMWAHYARSHEGFAARLNKEELDLNEKLLGPFPINYQNQWTQFDFAISPKLAVFYQTNIKDSIWSYEKEWRYIAIGENMSVPSASFNTEEYSNNRKMKYSLDAVEEIVLGFKFKNGLVRQDCKDGICKLEFEKTGMFSAKRELLNFICDNDLKASEIHLKEGSSSFKLEARSIVLIKKSDYCFLMQE